MAKVFMMCGKICVGKSTYADKLRTEHKAIVLSVDEITLALFGQNSGENHDIYVECLETYLFKKSLEIIETGINVILDWGFWMKEERDYAKSFYKSRNISSEFHYIDIDEEEWRKRINKRNASILAENADAYYVDDGLAQKCNEYFQVPETDEIDVWIKGGR